MDKKRKLHEVISQSFGVEINKQFITQDTLLLFTFGSDFGCKMDRYYIPMNELTQQEIDWIPLVDKKHDEDFDSKVRNKDSNEFTAFMHFRYCVGIEDTDGIQTYELPIDVSNDSKWVKYKVDKDDTTVPDNLCIARTCIMNYCLV